MKRARTKPVTLPACPAYRAIFRFFATKSSFAALINKVTGLQILLYLPDSLFAVPETHIAHLTGWIDGEKMMFTIPYPNTFAGCFASENRDDNHAIEGVAQEYPRAITTTVEVPVVPLTPSNDSTLVLKGVPAHSAPAE
jgi:hypothetical protein